MFHSFFNIFWKFNQILINEIKRLGSYDKIYFDIHFFLTNVLFNCPMAKKNFETFEKWNTSYDQRGKQFLTKLKLEAFPIPNLIIGLILFRRYTSFWFTCPVNRNILFTTEKESISIPFDISVWNLSNMLKAFTTHSNIIFLF